MSSAASLLESVYTELRRLAAAKMATENPGQTLQATALVHEAWLRLSSDPARKWQDRRHFFATAAEAMRCILIDNARRKRAHRHGGGLKQTQLEENLPIAVSAPDHELLAVHESLDRLAEHDARKAELVKLRYFMGMTLAEAGEALGVSEPTAKRDWAYARAWLARDMRRQKGEPKRASLKGDELSANG